MRYDEFKSTILNSELSQWSYDDDMGLYLFLEDIRISITADRSEESFNDTFEEEWLESFPDSRGYRRFFDLKFNGNVIERFFTVSVDGSRNYIPLPRLEGMTITSEQYALGNIVNKLHNEVGLSFDSYLSRAGISVIDLVEQN